MYAAPPPPPATARTPVPRKTKVPPPPPPPKYPVWPCPPTKRVRSSPAVRKTSPETSAPRPPAPPIVFPPLAPRSSTAYSPLTEAVKENIPGIVNVSAFASAAQAKIARVETPASKSVVLDLIMAPPLPMVALRDCPASLSGTDFIADRHYSQITLRALLRERRRGRGEAYSAASVDSARRRVGVSPA